MNYYYDLVGYKNSLDFVKDFICTDIFDYNFLFY